MKLKNATITFMGLTMAVKEVEITEEVTPEGKIAHVQIPQDQRQKLEDMAYSMTHPDRQWFAV
jgi:hypothetical protein